MRYKHELVLHVHVSCCVCWQETPSLYIAVNCTVVAATSSSSQLRCITVPGVGHSLFWGVTFGTQAASFRVGPTSYGRPVVSSFTGDGAVSAATSGSQVRPSSKSAGQRWTSDGVFFFRSQAPFARARFAFCLSPPPPASFFQPVAIFGANFGPLGTAVTAKYTTNRVVTSVVLPSSSLSASYVGNGASSLP